MKGQLSIDLLLTCIVALMIIGSFTVFLNNFRDNQEASLAESQLKGIASEAAAFITSSQAIADTNFRAELRLPKVSYKEIYSYPEIRFADQNAVYASISYEGRTLEAGAYFSKSADTNASADNGMLVVKNVK
jgi:hypothetical protein